MKKGTQLHKFLEAILERNLSTLEAEKIIGTTRVSNQGVEARKRFGLSIPCVLHPNIKPDGTKGTYGVYTPTERDREIIREILSKV